ncbi:NMD3 family-domain-containing protein [Lactifluus volemus]|nr:NMD3 family-domain-containing protein [Lactifluus volemus]
MDFVPVPALHRVLCANCGEFNGITFLTLYNHLMPILGELIVPNSANRCSQELLSICLKKLKILNRVPASTILEQVFETEYLVQHGQYPDCTQLAAKNTWKALVQVRQKVPHKRTFLYLEQLILKHGAQKDTIFLKEVKDGLDFFYSQWSHAIKMVEFLSGVVLIRSKTSERLLSTDTHSNTANFMFTYSVEIIPICKDDLVCLPPKLARQSGNIDLLTLCTRVGNSLTHPHCDYIEPSGRTHGKWVMADAQVAISGAFHSTETYEDDRVMDYETASSTNQIFHTWTHLGGILQPSDGVLGYHLSNTNFNSDDFASLPQDRIPDVVLVRKGYPNRRKKNKSRNWRLRSMAKGEGEEGEAGGGRGAVGEDYELFLRDLEEDPRDSRRGIWDETGKVCVSNQRCKSAEENEEEADFPEVKLE